MQPITIARLMGTPLFYIQIVLREGHEMSESEAQRKWVEFTAAQINAADSVPTPSPHKPQQLVIQITG